MKITATTSGQSLGGVEANSRLLKKGKRLRLTVNKLFKKNGSVVASLSL
jgi:hypothetical protein